MHISYAKSLWNITYCKVLHLRGIIGYNKKTERGKKMKANTYYLFENGKKIHFSSDFSKLLNYTTDTVNAEIYYNNNLIWIQNPARGTKWAN